MKFCKVIYLQLDELEHIPVALTLWLFLPMLLEIQAVLLILITVINIFSCMILCLTVFVYSYPFCIDVLAIASNCT